MIYFICCCLLGVFETQFSLLTAEDNLKAPVHTTATYVQDWRQVLFTKRPLPPHFLLCLLSTSYLVGLFDIFILLHIWQNCVCFGDFLPMRTLCDAYHKEFDLISVQSWTYLHNAGGIWKKKGFTLKTHQMFSVCTAPERFENASITGHFSVMKITWFLGHENHVISQSWKSRDFSVMKITCTLRQKPNIRARIRSNTDRRTPRMTQCSIWRIRLRLTRNTPEIFY